MEQYMLHGMRPTDPKWYGPPSGEQTNPNIQPLLKQIRALRNPTTAQLKCHIQQLIAPMQIRT